MSKIIFFYTKLLFLKSDSMRWYDDQTANRDIP